MTDIDITSLLRARNDAACNEAADEIERLRGEVAVLKEDNAIHTARAYKAEAEVMLLAALLKQGRELMAATGDEVKGLIAERDAAVKDAERYRYLRNRDSKTVLETKGPAAGCWIDCETDDELVLLTGDDADAAIDAARGEK